MGKVYTLEEVSKHSSHKDCWIVIHGKVYDVTKFLDDHPGGAEVILTSAGKDATDDFEDVGHSSDAKALLDDYYMGDIGTATVPTRTKFDMVGDGKVFTLAEVSKHSSHNDCWIVIHGKVYDVTKFLEDHPGGDEVIVSCAGKDATDEFEDVGHSSAAKALLDDYYVGDIDSATPSNQTESN